jgi:putative aldouronate transport system substrate-binding protein
LKRTWIVLVTLIFLSVVIFGCTKDNALNETPEAVEKETTEENKEETPEETPEETAEFPIVDEPITLTLMSHQSPIEGAFENLKFFQEMEQLTNIKLEYNLVPNQSYKEKKNLAFASGELPDFFYRGGLTPQEEAIYGAQGILIPLEDLIEQHAPNLKKRFKEDPDLRSLITSSDGHIYSLPQVYLLNTRPVYGNAQLHVEKHLLEESGHPMPSNTEELYDLLKTFKEQGLIPFSSNEIEWLRVPIMAAFGLIPEASKAKKHWVQMNNDQVEFVPILENYKAYLEYMNRLYEEGLIDSQIFSHTKQEFVAKGHDKKLAVFNGVNSAQNVLKVTTDDVAADKILLFPPLTSHVNEKPIYPKRSTLEKGNFAITNKNPYPAETIRWADFFYSTRGAIFHITGELLDEEFINDPAQVFVNGSNWPKQSEIDTSINEWVSTHLKVGGGPGYYGGEEFNSNVELAPHMIYHDKKAKEVFDPVAKYAFPDINFALEEYEQLQVMTDDIVTYVEEMHAKVITGAVSIETWDKYVETLNKMNIDEYVQIYQKAYDRWKSSK